MPGGNATKPGDVLRAMNGKTIEVINTDAEGRLILADALCYAMPSSNLSPIVDVATLTGAISIALGNVAFGVFTNDDALRRAHRAARASRGREVLAAADVRRVQGADQERRRGHEEHRRPRRRLDHGGVLPQGVRRRPPWAHLDIAGVDFFEKEKGVIVKGASGIPVRTLVNLALDLAERPL